MRELKSLMFLRDFAASRAVVKLKPSQTGIIGAAEKLQPAVARPMSAPPSKRAKVELEDRDSTIDVILNSKSLFGRLGLPEEATDVSKIRKTYRLLALKTHPDKCADERATEAFQLLSEAFDVLHNQATQRTYLAAQQSGQKAPQKSKRKSGGKRWYQQRSWEDIERHLRQREAAETALRRSFQSSLRNKFAERKARGQLATAERTAYDLDEKRGIADSEYAPEAPDTDSLDSGAAPVPVTLSSEEVCSMR